MRSPSELLQFDFNADTFVRRAPKPIPILPEMIADLDRIQREHDGMHNIPEREDLRQVYHLFFNAVRTDNLRPKFDSSRRIRRLAWSLTFSEAGLPRIVDTPELHDALQLIEDRFHMSTVLGVFDALLQAWDKPGARLLREFVRRHLATYQGRQQSVQNLRENLAWYCEEDGATQLAMSIFRGQVKLSEVWSHLNLRLPDRMHGFRYFGIVAEAYVALNCRLDRESVADIVKFVEMHRNDTAVRSIVSRLIEALGLEASEHVRQPVQSYVRRNWRDPRVTGGENRWRHVSDEAQRIFTRWITKEDLNFFFDVVAQVCHDEIFAYRKAFWLAYLEHISFCRPVLRRNAEYLFRNNPYYQEQKQSIATLNGGSRDQHAFIIQMGDYTFVEFSTNAACYVYDNSRLPFRMDQSAYTMDTWRRNTLRNSPLLAKPRVIHRNSEEYYWQEKFELWLSSRLGIEPIRSYWLNDQVFLCPGCRRRLRITSEERRVRITITCRQCHHTFEREAR